jgi:hypothetical protein
LYRQPAKKIGEFCHFAADNYWSSAAGLLNWLLGGLPWAPTPNRLFWMHFKILAAMHNPQPQSDEVDQLMLNAELRDELERYVDESITRVNVQQLTLAAENDFLASMLAWEQAPILPIYRWFEPELRAPRPEMLNDASLESILWDVIRKLHQKRIVLDFTDHLSDRELYCLIYRDILPAREKKLDHMNHYLHWDCTGPSGDPDVWLRFYASDEEREEWADCYGQPLPQREVPPYPRMLPREMGQG